MSEPFIGEIRLFGFNFAPQGWDFCHGQLLPISQNQALFSLLGTTYGGDGETTFALPDLRGRVPVQSGNGPGLSSYRLGQKGGVEQVVLDATQMPAHQHEATSVLPTNAAVGDSSSPDQTQLAISNDGENNFSTEAGEGSMPVNTSLTDSGGNQAHENRPPYLAMNYIIAVQGIYPSRS